jgi:predicted amidohydrolase YtcJ
MMKKTIYINTDCSTPPNTRDELITKYHEAGLQIAVHANGDAAIDLLYQPLTKPREKNKRYKGVKNHSRRKNSFYAQEFKNR